ncbi:Rv3654c family TadE-like protein [Gordonia zhaorongruii]|uniref:Rv3654c family TadE-like protein n=1 Tax=Gordonia zhaorongruii TaxID=2597659 RepID=UPI001052F4D3|nr:Rv3654c family TadE-like protein [Gordonia zhaorongruii]
MRMQNDDGFSTIVGAAVIAALATVLVAVVYLGAAVVARHRAQSAADLAALAAASAHASGAGDPCAVARSLIGRQDGGPRVDTCRIDGQDVVMHVLVSVRLGALGVQDASASARAGPVD